MRPQPDADDCDAPHRAQIERTKQLTGKDDRCLALPFSVRVHPMEWVTESFKEVNNGRLKDVSLPRNIDLIIPDFGRSFGEFTISVIDTKGVDEITLSYTFYPVESDGSGS